MHRDAKTSETGVGEVELRCVVLRRLLCLFATR